MAREVFHIYTVWNPIPANVTAEKTFKEHWDIIQEHGHVYWGVITRRKYKDRHPFEDHKDKIQDQLKNKIKTNIYISPRDEKTKLFRGIVTGISQELPNWKDLVEVPQYYKRIEYTDHRTIYWFRLIALKYITHDEFDSVEPLYTFDSKKHGSSGYPYPSAFKLSEDKAHHNDFQPAPDYSNVTYRGVTYYLSTNQSMAIELLDYNRENGLHGLRGDTILERIESESKRFIDVFKGRKCAWKALITSPKKGVYKLNI